MYKELMENYKIETLFEKEFINGDEHIKVNIFFKNLYEELIFHYKFTYGERDENGSIDLTTLKKDFIIFKDSLYNVADSDISEIYIDYFQGHCKIIKLKDKILFDYHNTYYCNSKFIVKITDEIKKMCDEIINYEYEKTNEITKQYHREIYTRNNSYNNF